MLIGNLTFVDRSRSLMAMILINFILFSGCSEAPSQENNIIVRPAKLIKVALASNIERYQLPAIVEATTSRELTFQSSGQIQTLTVKSGDDIKKGQLIARLDQRQLLNAVKTAQAQYQSAKREFERSKKLITENAIAKNTYEQRRTAFDIAQATLDSATKSLEDASLYSPFDGVVAVTHAKALQTVNPFEPVITLDTFGAAEAVVKIPANIVALEQQFELSGLVMTLDVAPEFSLPARMVEVSTIADSKSQTYEARFSFTPPESITILPGMTGMISANAEFISADKTNQISIPLSSIQSDTSGTFVWLVNTETMQVSRREITIKPEIGEFVKVTSGLNQNETIVGAGAAYLNEGMTIRPLYW